jgi:lysophospholipase L1-like esterase
MVVGSSTAFDSFVSGDNKAWPVRLATWLGRLAPEHPVEVINAGVPGYRVLDQMIRLQTELYRFKPDLIVLYEGHNDLVSILRHATLAGIGGPPPPSDPTPGEIPVVTPWEHWLSRHSMLYSKVWLRFKALSLSSEAKRVNPSGTTTVPDWALAQGFDQFERDLTSFLLVARGLGIRVVVPEIVQVSGVGTLDEADPGIRRVWAHGMPMASVPTVLSAYHRYGERIRAVTDKLGVTFIPTDGFDLRGLEWYVEDDPMHFNDRGADRMGQAMARALLRANPFAPVPTKAASG